MTQLVRYDQARHALQVASSVDEAKDIRDKAAALEAYARQRNDIEMERWVAEIKLRAVMRIGELSRELDDGRGVNQHLPSNGKKLKSETLKAAGISTSSAHRAEQLATHSKEVETYIAKKAEQRQPVKYTEAIKAVEKATKQAAPREHALTSGDYLFNSDDVTAWRIEHKCEYANTYRNFFLETFSNKSRGKPGWLFTNNADFLLYHFLREGEVYLLSLPALRAWLYGHISPGVPRAHKYREKEQRTYEQKNDTWGYCVSIPHVLEGMQVRTKMVPPLLIDEREAALRSIGDEGRREGLA